MAANMASAGERWLHTLLCQIRKSQTKSNAAKNLKTHPMHFSSPDTEPSAL